MNLLFLSVGRRCELVKVFRSALIARGGGRLHGSDISALAPGLYKVDQAHAFPHGDSPQFAAHLIRICRDHQIDLVIPTIDPDLLNLDRIRAEFEREVPHCRLLLAPSFSIKQARDKTLSRNLFVSLGIAVPENFNGHPAAALRYPVFVKPKDGSAGEGARSVPNAELLLGSLQAEPNLVVEEFIDGPEYTLDVLCDFAGQPLLAIPRRRIRVRGGEVVQGVVERNSDLEALAYEVARAFRATGPITVQFRQGTDGRFYGIEVNARMGGGLPLSVAAGADWPGWILDMASGRSAAVGSAKIQDGLMITRYDSSVFVSAEQYRQFESLRPT